MLQNQLLYMPFMHCLHILNAKKRIINFIALGAEQLLHLGFYDVCL
jgi:hypothetical protein